MSRSANIVLPLMDYGFLGCFKERKMFTHALGGITKFASMMDPAIQANVAWKNATAGTNYNGPNDYITGVINGASLTAGDSVLDEAYHTADTMLDATIGPTADRRTIIRELAWYTGTRIVRAGDVFSCVNVVWDAGIAEGILADVTSQINLGIKSHGLIPTSILILDMRRHTNEGNASPHDDTRFPDNAAYTTFPLHRMKKAMVHEYLYHVIIERWIAGDL